MSAVARIYRWEIAKLLAQKRTYLGLGAAMLVPTAFVVALVVNNKGGPNDIPLGRTIRDTGVTVPFVVLFFMSFWAFPLITALVAGDIVAAESHNGTLKTILTRSRERGQVFAAKALASITYAQENQGQWPPAHVNFLSKNLERATSGMAQAEIPPQSYSKYKQLQERQY